MDRKRSKIGLVSLSCLMTMSVSLGGEYPQGELKEHSSTPQIHLNEKNQKYKVCKKVSFDPKYIKSEKKYQKVKKYKQLDKELEECTRVWDSFVDSQKSGLKMQDLDKLGSFMFKFKHTVLLLRKADSKLLAKIKKAESFEIFIKLMTSNKEIIRVLSKWFRDNRMRMDLAYLLNDFQ